MTILHLTAADYRIMPWANGLGQTVEMIRRDDHEGNLLWRLSMATVTEDGPFSLFPYIERNLTVLSGDGFDLVEDDSGLQHRAGLLTPVAFAGDIPITARNVAAPCQDFNVMTRRSLPKPLVWVEQQPSNLEINSGEQLALFALSTSTIQTKLSNATLKTNELLMCQQPVELLEGSLIVVALECFQPSGHSAIHPQPQCA